MSKITRETILDAIDFKESKEYYNNPCWTNEEIINAMVAAYNRALDDVTDQLRGASMRSESDLKEAVGKLKI